MSAAKIAVMKGIKKWLTIAPFGKPIKLPSSRFLVAFKTPRTDLHFAPDHMTQKVVSDHYKKEHNVHLRFIFDLTNTDRYYEFKCDGEPKVEHFKMSCAGKELPSEEYMKEFMATMEKCEEAMDEKDVIGIHCTHGVNRTGYLVVYYLCKKYDIPL